MENGTSAQVRNLVRSITRDPGRLPLAEIVDIASSQSLDVTLDFTEEPVVVYTRPRRHPALKTLTRREAEVAALLAAGYSNRRLASELFISVGTAKDHVHAILAKTGFENRSQVAAGWLGAEVNEQSDAGGPTRLGHGHLG